MRYLIPALAGLGALAACTSQPVSPETDAAALHALDKAYTAAWMHPTLQEQEDAVLALFAEDAAILPGAGTEPSYGKEAIREFWFPKGSPPTLVSVFEHTMTDYTVSGDLAVYHGRYTLRFDYDGAAYSQLGNYMVEAERQSDGTWLVATMTWNDHRTDE